MLERWWSVSTHRGDAVSEVRSLLCAQAKALGIEVAALNDKEIIQLSALIKNIVIANFKEQQYESVFVKSSTGFYKTEDGKPNGATVPGIKLMLENSFPLPVKAAGGVRTYEEAIEMIALGVKRIGTSSAKAIASGSLKRRRYHCINISSIQPFPESDGGTERANCI